MSITELAEEMYENGWQFDDINTTWEIKLRDLKAQTSDLSDEEITELCERLSELEEQALSKKDSNWLRDVSGTLYDGGWRSCDKDELKEEYGFSNKGLEHLCECLAEREAENK